MVIMRMTDQNQIILKSNIYSLNNSMRIMMEKFDHPEKFMAEGAQIKEAQEG